MAKKSRRAAARYSQLSKAKKKKQRGRPSFQTGMVSAPESQEIAEPRPIKPPVSKTTPTTPRARPEPKRAAATYQYVKADLKRLGILAGMMIIILIVLTFVLG
jgi:hypothetical protein